MELQNRRCLDPSMTRSVLGLGTLLSLLTYVAATTAGIRPDSVAGGAAPLVRVIVQTSDAEGVQALVAQLGGHTGTRLPRMNGMVAEVPGAHLARLTASPLVQS